MPSENSRESQLVLILDDDAMVTDGLAAGLEREGRTIITCNDLQSAELVVERLRPSHIVSDVRLSGPFGFEGLHFVRHALRFSPQSLVILMTGDAPEALQFEAAERGAVAFLRKPFTVDDLDSILDLLHSSELSSSAENERLIRMPILDEIIVSDQLRPLFQPIVELDGGRPFGYESLARYRNNSVFRNPVTLFQYAQRKERIVDLELACIRRSLETGAGLASRGLLFMNVHPAVLRDARALQDQLVSSASQNGVNLSCIILEITEQDSLPDQRAVFDGIAALRDLGVRFGLDDVGIAYSHLPYIDRIRPSFLKISQHFGTAFETDPTKMKIVMNLQSLANDFGCELVLEGIEHQNTAEVAKGLGIKYGQGYLLGMPSEPAAL